MGLVYREYQQELGKQHSRNDNVSDIYDKALETPQKRQKEQRQQPAKIVQQHDHSMSHSRSNQNDNGPFSMHNSSQHLLAGSEITTSHNISLQTLPDLDQTHGSEPAKKQDTNVMQAKLWKACFGVFPLQARYKSQASYRHTTLTSSTWRGTGSMIFDRQFLEGLTLGATFLQAAVFEHALMVTKFGVATTIRLHKRLRVEQGGGGVQKGYGSGLGQNEVAFAIASGGNGKEKEENVSYDDGRQTSYKREVGSGRKTNRGRAQRCTQLFLRCKLWTKVSIGNIESEAEVERDLFVSVWVDRDRESPRFRNVDRDTGGGGGGGGIKNGASASADLRAADEWGFTDESALSPDACSEVPHVLFMYCTLPPFS